MQAIKETQEQKEARLLLKFHRILKENAYEIIELIKKYEKGIAFVEGIGFVGRLENTGRTQFVNLAQIIHSDEVTSIAELKLFLDYQNKRDSGKKCFGDIKILIDKMMEGVHEKCIQINEEIQIFCEKNSDSYFYRKLQLMTVERLLVYLYWKTIKD